MKVKVLRGMVLVNKFHKTNEIKTCKDLGNRFLQKLSFECYEYDEICSVFHQYNFQNSLKERTRNIWTRENTCYKVSPKTNLEHIDMKQFLSSTKTQHELFFLEH